MKAVFLLFLLACGIGVVGYSKWEFVYGKWEEVTGLGNLRSEVKKDETEVQKLKSEGSEAAGDRDKLEEALKKLEKEFTEYKEKYKTSMRSKAPGFRLRELTIRGKEYQDATLISLNEDWVSFSHSGGIIRVEPGGLPADVATMLAINQNTPVHTAVVSLLRTVDDHKAGSINDGASVAGGPWRSRFGSGISKSEDEALKAVAIVSIKIQNGTAYGSGFLCHQGNKDYFYTNAHVVATGPKARIILTGGQILQLPPSVEISDEPDADDLVRFEVKPPEGIKPLQMTRSPNDVMVDGRIVALGDSGGAGVIPVLHGRISAFGPFALEAGVETIKGNSGGPVLVEGTNIVVGVVSRYVPPSVRDMGIAGTRFSTIRRICLRPDQVTEWKALSLGRLIQENDLIERCAEDSYLLSLLSRVRFSAGGVEGVDLDIFRRAGASTLGPLIEAHIKDCAAELHQQTRVKPKPAARSAFERFHHSVQSLYGADITGVDAKTLSQFHSGVYLAMVKDRRELVAELESHFAKAIAGIE